MPHVQAEATGSVPAGDTCVLGIQPTGDMHLGNFIGAVRRWVGGSAAGRLDRRPETTIDLLRGRPARDDLALRARRARLRTRRLATLLLASGLDPERSLLFVQSHVRGPRRAHLAPQLHRHLRRAARMTQFKDKSEGGAGVGVGRLLRLPGAHGLRHPALRHRRGAGRRRPAPARRARPRHRDAFQPPASATRSWCRRRRSRRSARGSWICSTRPGRCRSRRASPQGAIVRARRRQGDHQEDQVGGHRLRHAGASRRRHQARRVEPASRSMPR